VPIRLRDAHARLRTPTARSARNRSAAAKPHNTGQTQTMQRIISTLDESSAAERSQDKKIKRKKSAGKRKRPLPPATACTESRPEEPRTSTAANRWLISAADSTGAVLAAIAAVRRLPTGGCRVPYFSSVAWRSRRRKGFSDGRLIRRCQTSSMLYCAIDYAGKATRSRRQRRSCGCSGFLVSFVVFRVRRPNWRVRIFYVKKNISHATSDCDRC
jgi:hypothetical protein